MGNPYDLLGITPQASAAEIKAAYHRQLRQFPAHSHPQQFQQIRSAYETLQAAEAQRGDPLQPGPLLAQLDPDAVAALDSQLRNACRLTVTDLLRLTF